MRRIILLVDELRENIVTKYSAHPRVAVKRPIIQLIEDHDDEHCYMCRGVCSVNDDSAVIRFSQGDPRSDPTT